MKKTMQYTPPKVNNPTVRYTKSEEKESPNTKLKNMIKRIINKMKEDMYKMMNEFK
jgi:hypothetical protein